MSFEAVLARNGWTLRFWVLAMKPSPNYLGWHRNLDATKTQPTRRKFLTTTLDGTSA